MLKWLTSTDFFLLCITVSLTHGIKPILGLFTKALSLFINNRLKDWNLCVLLSQLPHCFANHRAFPFFLFVCPLLRRVILTGCHLPVPALTFSQELSFACSAHGVMACLCHMLLITGQSYLVFSVVLCWWSRLTALWEEDCESIRINSCCSRVCMYMGLPEQSKGKGFSQSSRLQLQERKTKVAWPIIAQHLESLQLLWEAASYICCRWSCSASVHCDPCLWQPAIAKKDLEGTDPEVTLWNCKCPSSYLLGFCPICYYSSHSPLPLLASQKGICMGM